MKSNLALYLCLIYALVLNGCAGQPDISGSDVDKKDGLFLVKGENICQEVVTSRMWQLSREGPFSSLEEANRYTGGLKQGGYDDWRLPTKSELFSLFYMHYWKNDGDCEMNHKGEFWVFSKGQEPSLGHWEDYFLCGPEFKFVKSIKEYGFVRAIRP